MLDILAIFIARDLIFLLAIGGVIVFVLATKKDQVKLAKLGVLSASLAFLFSRLASLLYFNPRPFVEQGITPLIAHAANNGFPSDHALLGFTLASIVYVYNKKMGVCFFLAAAAIGALRVYLGIHSPEDIVGSLVSAVIAVALATMIVRRHWKTV